MKLVRLLLVSALASVSILTITGCTGGFSGTTTLPISAASYLYLAQDSPNGSSTPSQILIYATGASGNLSPVNIITLPGSISVGPIAVDSAGNIYAATATDIREYAANAAGAATPIRLIPTNSITTLSTVTGLAVDSSGNIYALNFGVGIDVFSSTANGSVAPSRFIPIGGLTSLTIPLYIAVDSIGNLFVSNFNAGAQGSVLIFGPTANGNIAPERVLNQAAKGLATDIFGNLYLSRFNVVTDVGSEIDVFAPGASGNATPVRTLSLGQAALTGFAVGPAGDIYVGIDGSLFNNVRSSTPTFLEFSATASGADNWSASFIPTTYIGAGMTGMAAR